MCLYLGSCETSIDLLMRVASAVGRGAIQSLMGGSAGPSSFPSILCAEHMASSEACGVYEWEPASALTKTRSGTLWRAPPPLSRTSRLSCGLIDKPCCGG